MGGESSTLQSVHALNTSLETIESRLFSIEDIYLHHETSLVHGNGLVISGKHLESNESVNLAVGPILGRIDDRSVRIAFEIDAESTVQLHIFRAAEELRNNRYVGSVARDCRKGVFQACRLDGLEAEAEYLVYIGGVKKDDMLQHVARFTTLSSQAPNYRIFLLNEGKADAMRSGDQSAWDGIALHCTTTSIHRMPRLAVHTGSFVDLPGRLRPLILKTLHFVLFGEFSARSWQDLLTQLEECANDIYREALSDSVLRPIFCSCCVMFSGNEGEALGTLFESFFSELCILDTKQGEEKVSVTMNKSSELFISTETSQKDKDRQSTVMITLSILARIIRNVHLKFFRQLWDDAVPDLISRNNALIEKMKEFIVTEMKIKSLSRQASLLKSTDIKTKVCTELDYLKQQQISCVASLGDFATNSHVGTEDFVACLGRQAFIAIETCWRWIASDGSLVLPRPAQVDMSQQTFDAINELLVRRGESVDAVIFLAELFLPSNFDCSSASVGEFDGRPSLRVSESDTYRFCDMLGKWQSESTTRAALCVSPNSCSVSTVLGHLAIPLINESHEKLALLSFGSVLRTKLSLSQNVKGTQDRDSGFRNFIPSLSSEPSFKGPVTVQFVPLMTKTINSKADFDVHFSSPLSVSPPVQLVVGQVTSTTAVVLIDSSFCGFVNVHCVDCLTGVDHAIGVILTPDEPVSVAFEALTPSHMYDVFLEDSDSFTNFCTLQAIKDLQPTGNADDDDASSSSSSTTSRRCVLLVVGSNQSADRVSTFEKLRENGEALHRILSAPFNGIAAVIHGMGTLDWKKSRDEILKMIKDSESFSSRGDFQLANELKNRASVLLRSSLRTALNESLWPTNCANYGSHNFISSPPHEMLNTLSLSSLDSCRKDFSQRSVNELLQLLEETHMKMCDILWRGEANACFSVRGIEEYRVLLFEIRPSADAKRWLKFEHHKEMQRILTDPSIRSTFDFLVVLTPVPVITGDHLQTEFSVLSDEMQGFVPQMVDTTDILEFCADWMNSDSFGSTRTSVLVSSHSALSFSTKISFDKIQNKTEPSLSAQSHASFLQICPSSSLQGVQEPLSIPTKGYLWGKYKFIFEHQICEPETTFCAVTCAINGAKFSIEANFFSKDDFPAIIDDNDVLDSTSRSILQRVNSAVNLIFAKVTKKKNSKNMNAIDDDPFYDEIVNIATKSLQDNQDTLSCYFTALAENFDASSPLPTLTFCACNIMSRLHNSDAFVLRRPSTLIVNWFVDWSKQSEDEYCLLSNFARNPNSFAEVLICLFSGQMCAEWCSMREGL